MKYFIDTEFIEGKQDKTFLGIKYGETKPTIDLISIGIVAEDGREYYAISKDFNLYEAWNRYDLKLPEEMGDEPIKVYWIRDNVLYPIWKELSHKEYLEYDSKIQSKGINIGEGMTYKSLKQLINKYGKTNKQIAQEIVEFTNVKEKEYPTKCQCQERVTCYDCEEVSKFNNSLDDNVEFYGYYSDYDWVVFCQLFGTMMELPKGFPMFAFDIQQQIEEYKIDKEQLLKEVPQVNIHNSLDDARWNYYAYKWVQNKINNNA